MIRPTYRVTRYAVSALPEDHEAYGAFLVEVAARGGDRWAVTHNRMCANVDGTLSYESLSSSRTDEWLAEHRFTRVRAFTVALTVVNRLRVNGFTVAQVLADEHREERP